MCFTSVELLNYLLKFSTGLFNLSLLLGISNITPICFWFTLSLQLFYMQNRNFLYSFVVPLALVTDSATLFQDWLENCDKHLLFKHGATCFKCFAECVSHVRKICGQIIQTHGQTFQTRGYIFPPHNTYKICGRMFEAQTNHLNATICNWISMIT